MTESSSSSLHSSLLQAVGAGMLCSVHVQKVPQIQVQPCHISHDRDLAGLVCIKWPSGKVSASRAAHLGLIPAFTLDLFPG